MKTKPQTVQLGSDAGRGLTIIEMTVVILVFLSLVSILFMGARAWKRGSDRSANIMNLRNTQQAMRGHENLRANQSDHTFDVDTLQLYMRMPTPPNGAIEYDPWEEITTVGVLWLGPNEVGDTGGEFGPDDLSTAHW